MEISVKNKPDVIIFPSSHVNWLFVPQASQIVLIAEPDLVCGLRFLQNLKYLWNGD